jgi:branched-chain amino acid aminotransferase
MEAKMNGFDETIMLNELHMVAEGSGENIFMVKDGKLYTPPANAGILPGITRESLMKVASDMGYKVEERNFARSELYLADELFFTGTAAEVTPIREVDRRPVGEGKPGPVTMAVQKKYLDIVRGKEPAYSGWLDLVK